MDGKILARKDLEVERILKADILGSYTKSSMLTGGELILWQIPKTNTMINISGTLTYGRSEVLRKPTEDNDGSLYITGETELLEKIANYVQNLCLEKLENIKDSDETYSEFNLVPIKEDIIDKISELVSGENKTVVDSANDFHIAYGEYLKALKDTEIDSEDYNNIKSEYNETTNNFIKELLSNLIENILNYIRELINNFSDEEELKKKFFNDYLTGLIKLFYEEKESTPEETDEVVSGAEDSIIMPSEEIINEIIDASIKQYDLGQ